MDDIRDVLTNICLAGAAVSFAACLLIAGKKQLARAAAWRNEIQVLIDELSQGASLDTNDYRLVEYDLSQYPELIR